MKIHKYVEHKMDKGQKTDFSRLMPDYGLNCASLFIHSII